jgi:hypothetical protein
LLKLIPWLFLNRAASPNADILINQSLNWWWDWKSSLTIIVSQVFLVIIRMQVIWTIYVVAVHVYLLLRIILMSIFNLWHHWVGCLFLFQLFLNFRWYFLLLFKYLFNVLYLICIYRSFSCCYFAYFIILSLKFCWINWWQSRFLTFNLN